MLYLPLVLAILGLIFMIAKASWVNKQTTGNDRMQSIFISLREKVFITPCSVSTINFPEGSTPLIMPEKFFSWQERKTDTLLFSWNRYFW